MIFRSLAVGCGALLAFAVVLGMGTSDAAGRATIGPDMGAYVAPGIGPAEFNYVRAAMNQLPLPLKMKLLQTSPMQFHLTIIDGGVETVHYNRPDDVGSLQALPPDPLPGDDYPFAPHSTPAGNCGYPGAPFPGCYSGSGAYRRVYTPPVFAEATSIANYDGIKGWQEVVSNWGYYNQGTVSTACKAGIAINNAKHADAGFSYLGGWSTSPDSYAGTIDAGLQYDWMLKPGSADDYALFLKVSGEKTYVSSTGKNVPAPARIRCDHPASTRLTFWVMPYEIGGALAAVLKVPQCAIPGQNDGNATLKACASYAFYAESEGIGGGSTGAILWIAPSASTGNWGSSILIHSYWSGKFNVPLYEPVVPCGNCIFKWMTSIGQKDTGGFREDLSDGSTYSATWSNREIAPWAVTKGLELAAPSSVPLTTKTTWCSEYPIWTAPYNAGARDCRNTPAGLAGVASSITVSGFSLAGETDAISLTH